MLLEEEKNRIRAEEVFRQEVRREIETGMAKQSTGKQFWSVLNSSFALWFLSSVVIASLTTVVTMYQKSHSEQMQKTDIQRRLNMEISSRIAEGLVALHLDQKRIEGGKAFFASAISNEALVTHPPKLVPLTMLGFPCKRLWNCRRNHEEETVQ
jgi:hypothetical protein